MGEGHKRKHCRQKQKEKQKESGSSEVPRPKMTALPSHTDADTYNEEGLLKYLLTQHIVKHHLWILQLILKNREKSHQYFMLAVGNQEHRHKHQESWALVLGMILSRLHS